MLLAISEVVTSVELLKECDRSHKSTFLNYLLAYFSDCYFRPSLEVALTCLANRYIYLHLGRYLRRYFWYTQVRTTSAFYASE